VSPFKRSPPYESIVLRSVDIGEADRFCVFWTREAGRVTARARSVRKTSSRLGGSLLPFRHLSMELVERDGRSLVVSATDRGDLTPPGDFARLVMAERGVELLLALTEEGEPLPAVFDLLHRFILLCADPSLRPLPAFQLRLLHLLGLLPAHTEDERFSRLPPDTRSFVLLCTRTNDLRVLTDLCPADPALDAFLRTVQSSHLSRPLKSEGVGE